MSIYVMTVGELAKKRGEPVGEFVKKIQELGFDAGSHAKKLTQKDLDSLIWMLETGGFKSEDSPKIFSPQSTNETGVRASNPNVLLIKLPNDKFSVVHVDASIDESGKIKVDVLEHSTENTVGEALLEFRKQMGLKMGVN